jgi:hypothetical protein
MKLTTHLHTVPGLGMSGAVPSFSLRLHRVQRDNFTFKDVEFSCVVSYGTVTGGY